MKNQVKIKKNINPFKKEINVSSDKSISIRCLLLSSIAIGRSKIFNILESEDVINTLRSLKKIGVNFKQRKKVEETERELPGQQNDDTYTYENIEDDFEDDMYSEDSVKLLFPESIQNIFPQSEYPDSNNNSYVANRKNKF